MHTLQRVLILLSLFCSLNAMASKKGCQRYLRPGRDWTRQMMSLSNPDDYNGLVQYDGRYREPPAENQGSPYYDDDSVDRRNGSDDGGYH